MEIKRMIEWWDRSTLRNNVRLNEIIKEATGD